MLISEEHEVFYSFPSPDIPLITANIWPKNRNIVSWRIGQVQIIKTLSAFLVLIFVTHYVFYFLDLSQINNSFHHHLIKKKGKYFNPIDCSFFVFVQVDVISQLYGRIAYISFFIEFSEAPVCNSLTCIGNTWIFGEKSSKTPVSYWAHFDEKINIFRIWFNWV